MDIISDNISTKEIVITSSSNSKNYWKDIYNHRGLLSYLIWRDLVVRYKQTAIGILWMFIKAGLNVAVMSLLFGKIFKLESNGLPYSIVIMTGLLIWQLFSNVISDSSNCLVSNSALISKVYFPRLVLPISTLVLCLVDFLISFLLLVVLLIWNGISVGWSLLAMPFFVLLSGVFGISLGIMVASISVKYRDIKQLIPFLLQVGMYASPVAYMSTLVPDKWKVIYSINPLVGIIDGFRWSLLGDRVQPYWIGILYSIVISIIILYFSIIIFRNAEKNFADEL
jgi:lipopolysaccharide transport system permease protein